MSERRYNKYFIPSTNAPWYTGNVCDGPADSQLVNSVVNTYAHTRRNALAITANAGTGIGAKTLTGLDEDWWPLVDVPVGNRVTTPGSLKVYLYGATTQTVDAGDASSVYCRISCGGAGATCEFHQTTAGWTTASLNLTDQSGDPLVDESSRLRIEFRTYGSNTLAVYSVQAHQPGDTTAPAHVDLSGAGCRIGSDDWPADAAQYKILRDEIACVRGNRTVRGNVFSHWYGTAARAGTSYAADNAALGRYKFLKREGVETVIVHLCRQTDAIGSNTATMRAEISDGPSNSITGASATFQYADPPRWDSFTFNFTGSDITVERECELILDAKVSSASLTAMILGVCVVEAPLASAALTHTVPNSIEVVSGQTVGSKEFREVKQTVVHLWKRGGMSIACADWRYGTDGFITEAVKANQTTGDKGDHGKESSVMARCILYPSTSAKRLRVSMGYHTTSGETYYKTLDYQIGDSRSEGVYDDRGPGISAVRFTGAAVTYMAMQQWETTFSSADYETPGGEIDPAGQEPLEVWIFAYTEDSTEYVEPDWVTVEEVPLAFGEFPD